MTLSIGPATDYLITKAQTAAVGITVSGKPVLVVDGEPSVLEPGMFVIGLRTPPPEMSGETTGTRSQSPIGNTFADEDYLIPCYIDVRVAGTVQKTARDLAAQVFDAFWAAVLSDRSLGGLFQYPVELGAFASVPSNVGTVAEPGRRQLITFEVHCQNLTA